MREETLAHLERWSKLTFQSKTGEWESVIDLNPYNSKGTQSFRTLLSAKIGSSRYMRPYNGFLQPLPENPETILRGFNSITIHPQRKHKHKLYTISANCFVERSTNKLSCLGIRKTTQVADEKENLSEQEIEIECTVTDYSCNLDLLVTPNG